MNMQMITLPEVMAKVRLKKTAIYDRIKHEGFPEPVKFGSASRWVEAEVEQWLHDYASRHRKAG